MLPSVIAAVAIARISIARKGAHGATAFATRVAMSRSIHTKATGAATKFLELRMKAPYRIQEHFKPNRTLSGSPSSNANFFVKNGETSKHLLAEPVDRITVSQDFKRLTVSNSKTGRTTTVTSKTSFNYDWIVPKKDN